MKKIITLLKLIHKIDLDENIVFTDGTNVYELKDMSEGSINGCVFHLKPISEKHLNLVFERENFEKGYFGDRKFKKHVDHFIKH